MSAADNRDISIATLQQWLAPSLLQLFEWLDHLIVGDGRFWKVLGIDSKVIDKNLRHSRDRRRYASPVWSAIKLIVGSRVPQL